MNATTFTTLQNDAATIGAACIGKGMALATMQAYALAGADDFRTMIEATRQWFVTSPDAVAKSVPAKTSLSVMQKTHKVKGVSTFYTYAQPLLRMAEKGDTAAILAATTKSLTVKKSKPADAPQSDDGPAADASAEDKAQADTPTDDKAQAVPLTVDACIAFLAAADKATGLTPEQYGALQALIPMPAPAEMQVAMTQH